jgi:hypothetical protein
MIRGVPTRATIQRINHNGQPQTHFRRMTADGRLANI